jgi:DSF synthase
MLKKSISPPAPGGFRELTVDLDVATGIAWCRFRYTGRPCFRPEILAELKTARRLLAGFPAPAALKYAVMASATPGVFSLGSDLELVQDLIRNRDRDGLMSYARICIEALYEHHTAHGLPVITASLVQGRALGSGFECALASDVIVAETGARMGFPEVLFNLFPGMGALSLLSRRIRPAEALRLITSGRVYPARELYDLGMIDVLADPGQGTRALLTQVKLSQRTHVAHRALRAAHRRVAPLEMDELLDVAGLWVETALSLTETDLRQMSRLVAEQQRTNPAAAG